MDNLNLRLAQTVVLLARQRLLTRHLVSNQGSSLHVAAAAIAQNQHEIGLVLSVYNYAFALVDNLVRYQKIAHSLPQFNKKSLEFRTFDSAMGQIKEARNQHQHINNDIENEYTGPLLGSICWV